MKKLILLLVFVSMFAQETTHIVKPDDTLWDIAEMYYQNPFLWPYIWRANLSKIEDPHWIYPDQSFIIPPSPEEMMAKPPQASETPVVPEIPETPMEMVSVTPSPKKPAAEVITLVTPDTRIFSETFIHRAGFIVKEDIPPWAHVIETEPAGEANISTFKKIYIDRSQDIKVGDVLTIYRSGKTLTHPKTGNNLGMEIIVLGKAVVEDVAEGGSRCKVTASYDLIKMGDNLIPYEQVLAPQKVTLIPAEREIEGYLVEVKRIGALTSPNVFAYIDKGENDGIAVGDIFDVYQKRASGGKDLPDFKIGEVQIISIFQDASIGLLLWYRETAVVERGERCRLAMEAR